VTKRTRGPKRKSKKPGLKRAGRLLVKTIWKYLVQIPEEEREKDIAAIERILARKFKQLRRKIVRGG